MIVLSLINQPNFVFIANEIPKTIFQLVEITNNQFHFTVVNFCFFGFLIVNELSRDSNRTAQYKKLITYEQKLNQQGATIADINFKTAKQLNYFRSILLNKIKWRNRYQYISLMSEFIEEQILVEQYINRFFDIEKKCQTILVNLEQDSDKIENLSKVSDEFSQLLQEASLDCQNFKSNGNSDNETTISLKKNVHRILLKLQKNI